VRGVQRLVAGAPPHEGAPPAALLAALADHLRADK
jgi:hypothetical protein